MVGGGGPIGQEPIHKKRLHPPLSQPRPGYPISRLLANWSTSPSYHPLHCHGLSTEEKSNVFPLLQLSLYRFYWGTLRQTRDSCHTGPSETLNRRHIAHHDLPQPQVPNTPLVSLLGLHQANIFCPLKLPNNPTNSPPTPALLTTPNPFNSAQISYHSFHLFTVVRYIPQCSSGPRWRALAEVAHSGFQTWRQAS